MSLKAFEDDGLLATEVARLVREFKIQSSIETGTEYGGTAVALSQMVSQVVTCDIERRFSSLPDNVRFIQADSRIVLPFAIGLCAQPILFYLDAHTQNFDEECPLNEELREIGQFSHPKPPVIVVHDCLVPGHPELGYASYKGIPISLDAIHTQLSQVYPSRFGIHYNKEALGAKRGVMFVTPT